MTRVLALDLATRAGFALVDGGDVVVSGSVRLDAGIPTAASTKPSLDQRNAMLTRALRRTIVNLISAHRPDVVAVERDFGRGSGGRLLACLQGAAHEAALDCQAAALSIPLSTWRTAIHGKPARGERRTTDWFKAEAMRLVPEAADADAAEAVLIGRYVAAAVRITPPAATPMAKKPVLRLVA